MGAKNLKSLFTKKPSSQKGETKADTIKHKQEIEQYKKAITDKLKDPKVAEKAASILEGWINKK